MIHPPAKYNKPEASEDLDKGPNPLNTFSNSNFGTDFIKDTSILLSGCLICSGGSSPGSSSSERQGGRLHHEEHA